LTHLLVGCEGFPEGLDAMMEDIRNGCIFEQTSGSKLDIGSPAIPTIREIRFYDVVVKECVKDKVLGALKPFALNKLQKENPRRGEGHAYVNTKPYLKHGNDSKGFGFKAFNKLMGWVLKKLNMNIITLDEVQENTYLQDYITKRKAEGKHIPWHGYLFVFGELKDPVVKEGVNKGRENT